MLDLPQMCGRRLFPSCISHDDSDDHNLAALLDIIIGNLLEDSALLLTYMLVLLNPFHFRFPFDGVLLAAHDLLWLSAHSTAYVG